MQFKTTINLIKANVVGFTGHSSDHTALIETDESKIEKAMQSSTMLDLMVPACGIGSELWRKNTENTTGIANA
jgi:fructose 1,6-bisphosphatase